MMNETIEQLTEERVDGLRSAFSKSDGYFEKCFAAQRRDEIIVLVARRAEDLHGYLKVVWRSGYPPFQEQGIPEIQDLNVVPAARRKGVATRLMDDAERLVAQRSSTIGIGVGLHPGYAAAQRMYVLRGYVPDAQPITCANEAVTEGQDVKLDDELVLHMTKELEI